MKRVVIIGGGISGLAAAHRILEQNQESGRHVELMLLEASPKIGGIVQTEERDGFLLERGPDSFISEKPQALDLAKRLGIESHLIHTNREHRRSFIVRNGKLLPVPEGFQLLAPGRLRPFFTSEIFSWRGKARMAMDLLLPRGPVNGTTDESLAQFVRRRLGREALERMAQPMVGGIYTADPETLSLRATMPRFQEMERKHRSLILAMRNNRSSQTAHTEEPGGTSGVRYSLFLSFDRGLQLLTETLASKISTIAKLQSMRNPLVPGTGATSLECVHDDGALSWRIGTTSGETLIADAVCLALPAFGCAQLLRDLDSELALEFQSIPYESSVTVNLAYKREDIPHPLDGFGFVVPFSERRSIMACTFSSVKFAGRAPQDKVLLRVFLGGALQPELNDLAEPELISKVRSDLRDLLGVEREPIFHEVSKWRKSMPQYQLGHMERVKRIRKRTASLSGLALAGNAYTGPGIPDCIRCGEEAAESLIHHLMSLPKSIDSASGLE